MNINELTGIVTKLRDQNLTVAFAESSTAGLAASEFAKAKGTSDVFIGSMVTYSAEAKQKVLGVKKETLELYSAESQQVTNEMVMGLHKLLKADVCVAVTGLCGAGGSENSEKPVGSTFLAIFCAGKVEEYREIFDGDFSNIRKQTVDYIFQKIDQSLDRHFGS